MRGWQRSRCCLGPGRAWVRVPPPLSSLHPSLQQKTSAQKAGRSLDGWRGALHLGRQRRSGIPPCPLLPARHSHPAGRCPAVLTRMSVCCLVVARGLAGGSHIARVQTVPGVGRRHWGRPWEHFVSSQGGTAQLLSDTCLAWERGGSVSFNCLGKLSPPACLPSLARGAGSGPIRARRAVWCQELALGER